MPFQNKSICGNTWSDWINDSSVKTNTHSMWDMSASCIIIAVNVDTEHKKNILPGDVPKLNEKVFQDTPIGLLYRVFYEIVLHFRWGGRQGLRSLTPDFWKLSVDPSGREFFEKCYNELDKNYKAEQNQDDNDGIMLAMPGDPSCLVYW